MVHEKEIRLPKRLSGLRSTNAPESAPPPPPPEAETKVDIDLDAALVVRVVEQLQQAVDRFDKRHDEKIDELQRFAVELGVLVAERLIESSMDAKQFGIEKIVADTIRRLSPKRPTKVLLHPADRALLEERSEICKRIAELDGVQIEVDPRLQRGEVKAMADDVGIWSNWRQGLEMMRTALLSTLPSTPMKEAS